MSVFNAASKSRSLTIRRGIQATGYRNMKDPVLLIEACCRVYDDQKLWPKGDETFCNFAVQDVAHYFDCKDLDDKTAEEICIFLSISPRWQELAIGDVQIKANVGSLVIAAATSQILGQGHGHVCVIRPGKMQDSAHWKCPAPAAMNLGRAGTCSISRTVNFAFVPMPKFYVWKESL